MRDSKACKGRVSVSYCHCAILFRVEIPICWQERILEILAGNPAWRALIFSTIGDLAFLAVRDEIEDDILDAIQASFAVVFCGGKDQPVAANDFVCAAFGEDLVASIGIK